MIIPVQIITTTVRLLYRKISHLFSRPF